MFKKINKYILFGILCFISAITLVIINEYNNMYANKKSKENLENILNIFAVKPENQKQELSDDYLGILIIPSLNLELPVLKDYDNNKMKMAPCKYSGSIETNNLVICAHNYKYLFGKIKNLQTNDEVIFIDMNQNQYHYEVKLVEVLDQTDITEMIESEFDLTLYTCTLDSVNRVTVRLNRI